MDTYELGRRIKEARGLAGLSVADAARATGLSVSWWRSIEAGYQNKKGERTPIRVRPESLARICRVVGLPTEEILASQGFIETATDKAPSLRPISPDLNLDGLDSDDIERVRAYIDGLRAGKA